TVTAVDTYFNPAGAAANGNVWFQTSDPYDTDGSTQTLLTGATTFAVQMFQAGSQSVQVFCAAPTCTYSTATVSGIPIIAGAINRVLVLLPNEAYATGKPPYAPASSGTGGKATP